MSTALLNGWPAWGLTMRNRNLLPSFVVLVWAAFLLPACSTFGYENIDTTRKAIVVASAEVRAVNLLLQDLIARRAISNSQATQALASLQQAKNHLQTALSAVDLADDPATGGTNLQRANAALSVAINLLAPLVENAP